MSYKLVVKDAFRQIFGRALSALGGFIVVKQMTPFLGPLRYGDYTTVLKYFAIRSALADFGLYVLALKKLSELKNTTTELWTQNSQLSTYYSKFVTSRFLTILIVYGVAFAVAYFIPSYVANPYLVRWLIIGMLFSATFMAAGIIQLPLQLFWKMEQVSIGLIIARVVQIAALFWIVRVFPQSWGNSELPLRVFIIVISTVLLSGLAQLLYVRFIANKHIPLKWLVDWSFTRRQMSQNRKYGFAYFLSSFHTLVSLILLSIFYPTIKGYPYVGLWALALSLIEIMLIVPSSLGNSIMQKITTYSREHKMKSYGNLLLLITRIGGIVLMNFIVFKEHLIYFIGGTKFLTAYIGNPALGDYGSDFLLPFLGVVLILSFIKQIFNYIYVSIEKHNTLLRVNLFGVVIGTPIGAWLIYKYKLLWWIGAQMILEVLFVLGSVAVARRHKALPKISLRSVWFLLLPLIITTFLGDYLVNRLFHINFQHTAGFFAAAAALNILTIGITYKALKIVVKGMTIEPVAEAT